MKRLVQLVVLVALLGVAGSSAMAQRSAGATLAERLSALREGWSFSADEAEQSSEPATEAAPAAPLRVAQAQPMTPRVVDTPAAEVETAPAAKAYPRLDARQLLPRRWFGAMTPETQPAPEATPVDTRRASTSSTGSARARLLRQAREEATSTATDVQQVAQRPMARAGSVLSPGGESSESVAPSRMSGRLARSIAAEVAESLIEPTESAPATEASPIVAEAKAPEASTKPAVDAIVAVEGSTPTETPEPVAPEPPIAASVGPNGSGVRVAAAPTTKLPMFIGDQYSSVSASEATPEVVADSEADRRAADAFEGSAVADTPVKIQAQAQPAATETPADDLLFTQSMPVLVSKVSGPRKIVVGREASYRVLLANRGDVAAERVVSRVQVPEWAEVVSVDSADGRVERGESLADDGVIVWRRDRLAAGDMIQLELRLIARTGRAIELAVTHSHTPIDASTLVEVQEPKLALSLVGPNEVLYGKPQLFRLTLSNPGTGVAEAVMLHLTPPGGDSERQTSHGFGSLAPGEQRAVEIELTAREAGDLIVAASAIAEDGVSAEIEKEVFCRRPALVVDWRGPAERYAGSPATYYFRVRNPGTATAPGVDLTVDLPRGFEPTPTEGTPTVKSGRMTHRIGALPAGEDRYFELRGVMRVAGANEIALRAEATDETRSKPVTAVTQVVALADLKLDVLDPQGPIATGQEIAYEVRVTNRGSNDAMDVRVLGLFSDGIEPHHVEGATSTIHDGRVAFDTIPRMAPGEERLLTIHARAHEAGTHLFRAEVLCRDLEIKLAAEETTRFFEDESIDIAAEGMRRGAARSDRYAR